MKSMPLLFVALALTALTAGAQEFSVYKWVDEDGVPQYTDRPPNTADAQSTGIRSRRTDPSAVMARAQVAYQLCIGGTPAARLPSAPATTSCSSARVAAT